MSDVDTKRKLLEGALLGIYWGELQWACHEATVILDTADDDQRRQEFLRTNPVLSRAIEGQTREQLQVHMQQWPIAQAVVRTLVAAMHPELRSDVEVPQVQ